MILEYDLRSIACGKRFLDIFAVDSWYSVFQCALWCSWIVHQPRQTPLGVHPPGSLVHARRVFFVELPMLGPWPLLPGRGPVRPDVEQKAGSDDGRRFGGWCLLWWNFCGWLSSELATSIASLCWITFQQRYMYCNVICPQEECTDGEELRWNPST